MSNDTWVEDDELDSFVYDMMQKYKGKVKSLVMGHRKNDAGDYIKLIGIVIKNSARGEGIGQAAMPDIIAYADDSSIPIKLQATSLFGSEIGRLVKFYEKFGFKKTDEENNMTYTPINTNR